LRWLVVGQDVDGRTDVVSQGAIETAEFGAGSSLALTTVFAASLLAHPNPGGQAPVRDVGVGRDSFEFRIVHWKPTHVASMHRTNTLDCICILHGSVDLVLDTQTLSLIAGDCVVNPGLDHGWQVGTDGCTIAIALLGVLV